MWWPQPKQATSATMSIVYITVGALMDVWTVIYYIYLLRQPDVDDNTFLWVYGFFFSGIVLMSIGFGLGWIGRAAKQAEVSAPPTQVIAPAGAAAAVAPTAQPVAPAPAVQAPGVATHAAPRV